MLHLLMEYARDEGLSTEPGFTAKEIRWGLRFNADGAFLGIIDLSNGDKKSKGRRFAKIPALSQPELVGGATERSQCLYESVETVALFLKPGEDAKKIAKTNGKHAFFIDALKSCAEKTAMPALASVAEQLGDTEQCERIAEALKDKKAKPGDSVTLVIETSWLLESGAWHDWWRGFRKNLSTGSSDAKPVKTKTEDSNLSSMLDLVTGEAATPMRVHPKISGLSDVGGLATGDSFVAFDKEAFQSFEMESGQNAAISEENATIYQQALNHLIATRSRRLGKSKIVYWYKGQIPPELDPVELVSPAPDPKAKEDDPWESEADETETRQDGVQNKRREHEKKQEKSVALSNARKLLESVKTGELQSLENAAYYMMMLSGASGRVMIRDWSENRLGQLAQNIVEWFEDLEIVARHGDGMAPAPKIMAVLGATVRDLKELNTPFIATMWRTAFGGRNTPIPQSALAAAFARFKIDLITVDKKSNNPKPFNHARMGLMKAYHIRNRKGVNMTPELNENMDNVPYQCGRLMAILADIQREALGDVGAGVVQRYYAAASATPALVFGRLIRNSTFHLGKMEGGIAGIYTNKLAAVLEAVKEKIPRTLSLEDQTLFALGYYQQIAKTRKEIAERVAAKKAAASTPVETTPENNQP